MPSTISLHSLAVHKTGVRQDMVLGFLARNELVASDFERKIKALLQQLGAGLFKRDSLNCFARHQPPDRD